MISTATGAQLLEILRLYRSISKRMATTLRQLERFSIQVSVVGWITVMKYKFVIVIVLTNFSNPLGLYYQKSRVMLASFGQRDTSLLPEVCISRRVMMKFQH
jgi:hypothetical protein